MMFLFLPVPPSPWLCNSVEECRSYPVWGLDPILEEAENTLASKNYVVCFNLSVG